MDARNTSCVTLVSHNNSNVSKYVSQHVKLTVYQVNFHVFVDNDVQNPISANDAYLFFAGLCCVCGCALPCPPDAHGRSPLLIVPSSLFRITSPLQRFKTSKFGQLQTKIHPTNKETAKRNCISQPLIRATVSGGGIHVVSLTKTNTSQMLGDYSPVC